ncbi:plastocyanin-like domain [Olea europaea subsp. europaea]|uniref:Plastocyanin-like domain n=1 Tax=Olea europaea subsp. europaea TaxID=158383 RepID=A0A8S0SFP5_OLEEU|nr:plastocyanin-like domain [Olea europaea subsp. europaea]
MKMAICAGFLVLLLISPAVFAKDITVGGNNGWTESFDYSSWTSSQTFNVGDNLVFNYGPTHSVYEVSRADYDNCNTGNPRSTHSPSPTTIPLSAAGSRYFICPTSNHCSQGMKLAVNVVAAGTPAPGGSPPSGSRPTPSSPNTPPAPPGTSAPPPPSGGAASIFGGMSNLIVGSLAALFVLMG